MDREGREPLNGSRERWRNTKLEFLLVELQAADVSADLATTSKDPEKAARYRREAWKALDAVVFFFPAVRLWESEKTLIDSRLAQLEDKLSRLGETQTEENEVRHNEAILATSRSQTPAAPRPLPEPR